VWEREGPWHQRVREECLAVRDAAGILDLPGFSRYRVKGEGARQWLEKQITGRVPRPGRIGLGYFADNKGRIVTEMSIMVLEDEKAGFHWAYGRSDHLGGKTGVDAFLNPDNVVHTDIVYAKGCPIIASKVEMILDDGSTQVVVLDGELKLK